MRFDDVDVMQQWRDDSDDDHDENDSRLTVVEKRTASLGAVHMWYDDRNHGESVVSAILVNRGVSTLSVVAAEATTCRNPFYASNMNLRIHQETRGWVK